MKCESFSSSGVSRPSPLLGDRAERGQGGRPRVCGQDDQLRRRQVRQDAGRFGSPLTLAVAAAPFVPAGLEGERGRLECVVRHAVGSSNSRISSSKIAPTRLTRSPVSACARALISSASAPDQSAGLSAQTYAASDSRLSGSSRNPNGYSGLTLG